MCFSPEASFTAAAGLAVVGYGSLKQITDKSQALLAIMPLLFAVQQLSEGVLWLALDYGYYPTLLSDIAMSVFLFFAYITWPIWLPFSLVMIEKKSFRLNLLLLCLGVGIGFTVINFYSAQDSALSAKIVDNSIQYGAYQVNSPWFFYTMRILYLAAVIVPCFISTFPLMWVFGLLVGISYAIAEYFYFATFSSVWCFFAAIVSISIFFILYRHKLTLQKMNDISQ